MTRSKKRKRKNRKKGSIKGSEMCEESTVVKDMMKMC